MDVKISKTVFLKAIALLLCVYIGIFPFFQPRKVQANPALLAAGVGFAFSASGIGWGWFRDMNWTTEQVNQINAKCTENLKSAFPDPADYNKQMNILQNINGTLLNGGEVDWQKYSGKLVYSMLQGIIDVLWPHEGDSTSPVPGYVYMGTAYGYDVFAEVSEELLPPLKAFYNTSSPRENKGNYKFKLDMSASASKIQKIRTFRCDRDYGGSYIDCNVTTTQRTFNLWTSSDRNGNDPKDYVFYDDSGVTCAYIAVLSPGTRVICTNDSSSAQNVPSVKKKIVNKVKLPQKLPQSVISNYNNYIDNSLQFLNIAPTEDELPKVNNDPIKDDPPDTDGYQDVTPDQEPTDTPSPTPTPEPTPTPSTPDYDGSSWIKPIGDFFAGLLSFLKDALIPTQTVDFSPLQNMSTDFANKFPFSLPGDIGKLFGVLQAEPRRPEFQMTFDLSKVGVPGAPIVWDLKFEQWDCAATIVKTALYIGFLISLVFISKNFMKN